MTSAVTPADRKADSGVDNRLAGRRTLRRTLTYTLVAVALLALLLLGALNYWQARTLITDATENVLVDQQATRAATVRAGLERLRTVVSLTAADRAIVDALGEFGAAFGELAAAAELLTAEQETEVASMYADLAAAITEAGFDAPDLLPGSAAARYLQYHYILQNPSEERETLVVSETDESSYATVHAARHAELLRLADSPAVDDLLLVDTEGTIVYSAGKRFDLGTNLLTGPYRDSALAGAVVNQVPTVPAGESIYVDFERYLPAGAAPTLFAAAAVRSGGGTIGVVVVQIRIAALDAITTSGGRWDETGLGDTGEAYIVGPDSLMRSNSRLWLEDPDAYLTALEDRGADPELARVITLFDSTVLLQPVETAAVEAAFDGEMFVGRSDNYLGVSTLSAASPVGAEQLDWVVVTSVNFDEATAPLASYTRRIALAAAILIPLVALIAAALASRVTRPVNPIVDAARSVAGGDLDVELPDLGTNEFGDVARRLNILTHDLRQRKAALEEEEAAITTILLSALPRRVVTQIRDEERDIDDLLDTATIVVIGVDGILDQAGIDQDSAVELAVRLAADLEQVARELGVERLLSSSTEHVFATGLTNPDPAPEAAATFVARIADRITDFGEEVGLDVEYRIGMCAGEVVAALVAGDQLTYGVIGEPVRAALALQSAAGPNQILVCAATAAEFGAEWNLSSARGLVDLRGEPIAARILEPLRGSQAASPEAGA